MEHTTQTAPNPSEQEKQAIFARVWKRVMAGQETPVYRIYKALVYFEAVSQHNESRIDSWVPREYDLNRTYAMENAAWAPYLTRLRQAILRETEEKIANEQ